MYKCGIWKSKTDNGVQQKKKFNIQGVIKTSLEKDWKWKRYENNS